MAGQAYLILQRKTPEGNMGKGVGGLGQRTQWVSTAQQGMAGGLKDPLFLFLVFRQGEHVHAAVKVSSIVCCRVHTHAAVDKMLLPD
jgi:hypothetical protein